MKKKDNILFYSEIKIKSTNPSLLNKKKKNIEKNLDKIINNIKTKKNFYHSLSKKFKFNFKKKDLKKYQKYKTIVIIGMGGSVLGAKAIYSFLQHKIKKEFIFFDNLDELKLKDFVDSNKSKKTLFIIISKSGNTIEAITNINYISKIKFNTSNTILITENNDNGLKQFAKDMSITIIEHKKYIGGRYSILSEVGMIPAYMMGLNIDGFRKNLLDYFKNNKKKILKANILINSQLYLSKKMSSIIFLNYSPQLNNFLYWLQQLIAESLGKKNKGLLPVISSAPQDHHSLLQLYLDGPKDKVFYIFSGSNLYNLKNKNIFFGATFSFLKNKKIAQIIDSQKKAFIKVLKRKKIPYREVFINQFTEQSLGELFSYFMIETAMIGNLINVNPFDQPAVDEVKKLTKQYLN